MPRLTTRSPKYRKHRASGQAVVTLNGKDHYLGKYDSPESKDAYQRLLAEWMTSHRQLPSTSALDAPTIDEIILAYLEFTKGYYVKHGQATSTQQHILDAMRPLHVLY